MRFQTWRINSYLLVLLTVAACGCQTSRDKDKELTLLELHMEATPGATERTKVVEVGRTTPVRLRVFEDPFVNTAYLTNAVIVESHGGFSIQLDYDKEGAWLLESATSLYAGKRVVVHAMFPESRWLAAPLPRRRISTGRLTFTPDCTREEADRIVDGLIKAIKKSRKL